jgi:hypothetical protein
MSLSCLMCQLLWMMALWACSSVPLLLSQPLRDHYLSVAARGVMVAMSVADLQIYLSPVPHHFEVASQVQVLWAVRSRSSKVVWMIGALVGTRRRDIFALAGIVHIALLLAVERRSGIWWRVKAQSSGVSPWGKSSSRPMSNGLRVCDVGQGL